MIIGTAGHIDHGKTSLVKALTGIDADRLKEEKARGISIELGFAYWPQDNGSVIGFVDVPGHERFVHTMLMGAQAIDIALLIVAADDGIMPQTREHLEILHLAGIARGIVAITKADRVEEARLAALSHEMTALLAPTSLAGSPLFAVSSLTGAGIAELAQALRAVERTIGRNSADKGFRLAIDRIFTLQGAGTVVTGMVLDGIIRSDDDVIIAPVGHKSRIRQLHAQNRPAMQGRAGERCALNLAGLAKTDIRRGQVVTTAAFHAPASRIDALVRLASGAKRGIQPWMPARLHHGTAEVGVRLLPLEDDNAAPLFMQLVLDQPIAARALDRFILRDVSASSTLAGGVFVDLRAPHRKRRTPERLALLRAMAEPDAAKALLAMLCVQDSVDLALFARDRGLMPQTMQAIASELGLETIGRDNDLRALRAGSLARLADTIAAHLKSFHAEQPDLPGLGLERLRLLAAKSIPAPLFRTLLRQQAKDGDIVLDGHFVRHASHSTALSAEDEALWRAILPHLSGPERFRPPRVRDLAGLLQADEDRIRRLCKRLERFGALHEVAHDHFFPRKVMHEMVMIAAAIPLTPPQNLFAAAAFRDALENHAEPVGRKVAIQILECFDRHGVTIRRGDGRRMNPHRLDLFAEAGNV